MTTTKKKSIVLIDHNDSFTYNIVEVFRNLKCNLTVVSYADFNMDKIKKFDRIILSPGPMQPKDYPKTFNLLNQYYKTKTFFGICLGHQIISLFFNSVLENLVQVRHGVAQEVVILKKSTLFNEIESPLKVGLYHSWVVKNKDFSKQLKVTSKSTDGLIMSMEHKTYPIYGVQFHPESFLTVEGTQIIKNFIAI